MIDIHTHVLPGQDDGAVDMEQSVAMLQMAAAAGATDIVATPHAGLEWEFDPQAVERLIAEVQVAVGSVPRIHYGCELRLTPERIEDALRWPDRYAIAHGGYVLVEFSDFLVPKGSGELFVWMISRGIRPIVAHPERNPILRSRLAELERWVEQGCLVQITAGSLFGCWGKAARDASQKLLGRNLVHFVASDAHDTKCRPPLLDEAARYLDRHFGETVSRTLLIDNPRAVLDGVEIDTDRPQPEKSKSWFAFW